MEAAFTSLEELTVFARQRGVEILLENIPNGFPVRRAAERFSRLTHLDLNFCFDTGHANIMEGVETAFAAMKDAHPLHARPRQRRQGRHSICFPFVAEGGTIDWPKTDAAAAPRGPSSIRCCWN